MVTETFQEKETYELGRRLGEEARAGQVYTLIGDLGVGKTGIYQGPGGRTWDHGTGQQPHIYDRTGI